MSLNIALDFQIAADRYRRQTAIVYHGLEISYAELANSIRHWAVILSRLGVQRGDPVALVMPNVPEFTIAYFAILHLGAVVVPLNTMLTERELSVLIAHSDARLVIAYHRCAAVCAEALQNVETCSMLAVTGSSEACPNVSFEAFPGTDVYWMDDEVTRLGDLENAEILEDGLSNASSTLTLEHEDVLDWRSFPDEEWFSAPWPVGGDGSAEKVSSRTHIPVGVRSSSTVLGRERVEDTPEWEALSSSDGRTRFTWSPAPAPTAPDDTAVILYTSGTTGVSKGALLTHFNLYSNAMFVREFMTGYAPGKRAMAILPLYHSFGQTFAQNAALFSGATVVMVSQFDPKRILQTMAEQRVGVLPAVPTMLIHLVRQQHKMGLEFPALYQIVSGGSPLPTEVYAEIVSTFSGAEVLEGYGLSETSPLATCHQPNRPVKPGSIGTEIVGAQVRIMREDRTFAAPGEIGEIVVRGHNVMKGYHKNPVATERAFAGPWFLTGDLGYCDEDGYFFLVNRKKDVIIRAGMNVYPRETEDVLRSHPAVEDVVVVGVPHLVHGEDVAAFIKLEAGAIVSTVALQKYCRQRLAAYKCPLRILFVDSFPRGATGKVLKNELKKALENV